jgi:hypothetical protein
MANSHYTTPNARINRAGSIASNIQVLRMKGKLKQSHSTPLQEVSAESASKNG